MTYLKSVLCLGKEHEKCDSFGCQCFCHHNQNCECFACKIRSVGFGDVPGGYKSTNASGTSKKEDF